MAKPKYLIGDTVYVSINGDFFDSEFRRWEGWARVDERFGSIYRVRTETPHPDALTNYLCVSDDELSDGPQGSL